MKQKLENLINTSILVGAPAGKEQTSYGSAFLYVLWSCREFSTAFYLVHHYFFLPSPLLSSG